MDTRVHIKNNAEYHGFETHAWQYMVSAQYDLASDHFYLAAAWRNEDTELIGASDTGHAGAEAMCLMMARFARALHRSTGTWPQPEEFGLSKTWVTTREEKAQAELDAIGENRSRNRNF